LEELGFKGLITLSSQETAVQSQARCLSIY